MNKLSVNRLLVFLLVFSFASSICEAQTSRRSSVPKQSSGAVNRAPSKSKPVKVKGPISIKKAKKQQEAKDKKLKKDYKKFVNANQKRSIEIQTPEVQDRMKQNIKNANSSYNAKKKSSAARTKKAGRKYK